MQIQFRNNNKEIFAPLKDKWLITSPEEKVRQQFICYLVNEYGYELTQMEQELQVSNAQRGQGRARADIVIWKSEQERKDKKQPIIVVDCHATSHIKNEDYLQTENYALLAGVKFFVTYYEIDNKKECRIFKFTEEKPPLQIVELENIPHANTLNNEGEIQTLLNKTKSASREEFKKIFFACHDIIRNNDKLSPEMAFDEISKILFIKIRYEKENQNIFNRETFLSQDKPYQELFNETKNKYKQDDIFEKNDTLRIKELTFLQILDKLGQYNLAEIREDIKGVAFEEFLGKTFRGDLGQFFTPRTLVDFMVQILDPQENELIADPCCGSGGFLIKTFEYIKDNIKNSIRAEKKALRSKYIKDDFESLSTKKQNQINSILINEFKELEKALDNSLENSRLHKLSYRCIYGTDAEPRSARTAKMNMIMQGDGHSGVHHHDGLLNVNGIFENRFDVILTNPPFGARISQDLQIHENDRFTNEEKMKYYTDRYKDAYTEALKQVNDNIGKALLSLFDMGSFSTLTEVIFVERCLKLLRKGGRMGIVLPEGFLNGSDLQKVREYVEGKAKILLIVSIPQEVFMSAGATVKSSLVFLKKFTEQEEIQYANICFTVNKEIANKYAPEIEAQEKIHKAIWHEIQAERAYIKDMKSIRISKSEKDLQMMVTNMRISKLQTEHKTAKAAFEVWKKELDAKITAEIKAEIKKRFDYEFPIVQVEKAGINSIGQLTQNDLIEVKNEFAQYRQENKLWGYEETPQIVNF